MSRIALSENNAHAIESLRQIFQAKKPIIWSGSGVSFAVAQAIAAICRLQGVPSFAVKLNEIDLINFAYVGFISRSGRDPEVPVDFLITQENRDISWAKSHMNCLAIHDIDQGTDPWLPLCYARETLLTFGRAVGLTLTDDSYRKYISFENCFHVWVFEKHIEPVQTLFKASEDKLNGLPLLAIEREEIGHGFHYRLWKHPHNYMLHLYIENNKAKAKWLALESWCKQVKVPVDMNFIRQNLCESSQIIETFCIATNVIEQWAITNLILPEHKPMPENFDQLRNLSKPISS